MAGMLLGLLPLACAAQFAAPAEGPVAFRRDRVPLDSETLSNLSRQLETLARGVDDDSAAQRRGTAQMLALALALDPANTSARTLITDFQLGNHQPAGEAAQLQKIQARIWQYIDWLQTPEAGEQGQALAKCLSDVIVISDPEHPRAKALHDAGETGAWAGWVPPAGAYEEQTLAEIEPPLPAEEGASEENINPIALETARIQTPMWLKSPATETKPASWDLAPAALVLQASESPIPEDGPRAFSLGFAESAKGDGLAPVLKTIHTLLENHHGTLPSNLKIVITSEPLQDALNAGKRPSVSAAAAVLASAAITGREPDATVIGLVDEDGNFTLPTDFWSHLRALDNGKGGRVVLPSAAAPYLLSVLALEKPELFLNYEVVLASSFRELLDLSAKVPDEPFATVSSKFQEIQAKGANQAVGQYVANPFIRRRLAEISLEAPYHASAKLLAIQGAGNRPTQIPRVVLLPELRRALAPMDWLLQPAAQAYDDTLLNQIATTYEACRSAVDQLDRYVEKDDRQLFANVQNLVATIRPLERAARARGDKAVVLLGINSARLELIRASERVAEDLAEPAVEPPALDN